MKEYLKPTAEYIDFDFKNLIANDTGLSGDMGVGDGSFGEEEE